MEQSFPQISTSVDRDRERLIAFNKNMVAPLNPIDTPALFLQQLYELLAGHGIMIQHICCIIKRPSKTLRRYTFTIIFPKTFLLRSFS